MRLLISIRRSQMETKIFNEGELLIGDNKLKKFYRLIKRNLKRIVKYEN